MPAETDIETDMPLICRDDLIDVIGMTEEGADTVIRYLRSVLTSEALNHIYGPVYEYRENGAITVRATGAGLHRRIFGEDR